MPPSRTTALAGGLAALLVATLLFVVLAIAAALPSADLRAAGVDWLAATLILASGVAATAATLAWIVAALRDGSIASALIAGSMAALVGAAVVLLIGAGDPDLALLAAAGFLLAGAVAPWLHLPALESRRRILVVAAALVGAELFAVVAIVGVGGNAWSLAASGLALAAAIAAIDRPIAFEAFALAGGAAALGVGRDGVTTAIGIGALAATAVLATRRALANPELPSAIPADAEERLPDLAARLADAVLRFDGRLRLADWNATAATLLELDESSRGVRMEELLGIPITSLPADDRIDTVERGIGGLDVTVHRAGGGVIALIRDPGRAPESERLGRELRGTIEELAQARRTIELQRAELERTATTDPLTGLPTRHAMLERLRTEVAEARRYRHSVAIVLLDIDNFSEVNRVHGTEIGDAALAEVALRLRLRVRTADALGRLGDDRFLAILPHTDEAGSMTFAEALRRRLGARELAVGRTRLSLTMSGGVAVMRPENDTGADELLARAEEGLVRARRAGGNRVDVSAGLRARSIDEHRAAPDAPHRPSVDEDRA